MAMTDAEFLEWVADRFVHVVGESPNVDFVHRLRMVAGNAALAEAEIAKLKSDRADLVEAMTAVLLAFNRVIFQLQTLPGDVLKPLQPAAMEAMADMAPALRLLARLQS